MFELLFKAGLSISPYVGQCSLNIHEFVNDLSKICHNENVD